MVIYEIRLWSPCDLACITWICANSKFQNKHCERHCRSNSASKMNVLWNFGFYNFCSNTCGCFTILVCNLFLKYKQDAMFYDANWNAGKCIQILLLGVNSSIFMGSWFMVPVPCYAAWGHLLDCQSLDGNTSSSRSRDLNYVLYCQSLSAANLPAVSQKRCCTCCKFLK